MSLDAFLLSRLGKVSGRNRLQLHQLWFYGSAAVALTQFIAYPLLLLQIDGLSAKEGALYIICLLVNMIISLSVSGMWLAKGSLHPTTILIGQMSAAGLNLVWFVYATLVSPMPAPFSGIFQVQLALFYILPSVIMASYGLYYTWRWKLYTARTTASRRANASRSTGFDDDAVEESDRLLDNAETESLDGGEDESDCEDLEQSDLDPLEWLRRTETERMRRQQDLCVEATGRQGPRITFDNSVELDERRVHIEDQDYLDEEVTNTMRFERNLQSWDPRLGTVLVWSCLIVVVADTVTFFGGVCGVVALHFSGDSKRYIADIAYLLVLPWIDLALVCYLLEMLRHGLTKTITIKFFFAIVAAMATWLAALIASNWLEEQSPDVLIRLTVIAGLAILTSHALLGGVLLMNYDKGRRRSSAYFPGLLAPVRL